MKILIGCEESQAVCKAFREKGHEAYSCDIQECSGGHPEWHIKDDVIKVIYGGGYDMLIGHPPCTYLSNAGNGHFHVEKIGLKAIERWENRIAAMRFFWEMWNAPIEKICLENPVGFLNGALGISPSQIIEPFYFGDVDRKKTCLWIKGLPLLQHSKQDNLFCEKTHVKPREPYSFDASGKARHYTDHFRTSVKRSKTFPGIAKAMADQWG